MTEKIESVSLKFLGTAFIFAIALFAFACSSSDPEVVEVIKEVEVVKEVEVEKDVV